MFLPSLLTTTWSNPNDTKRLSALWSCVTWGSSKGYPLSGWLYDPMGHDHKIKEHSTYSFWPESGNEYHFPWVRSECDVERWVSSESITIAHQEVVYHLKQGCLGHYIHKETGISAGKIGAMCQECCSKLPKSSGVCPYMMSKNNTCAPHFPMENPLV